VLLANFSSKYWAEIIVDSTDDAAFCAVFFLVPTGE